MAGNELNALDLDDLKTKSDGKVVLPDGTFQLSRGRGGLAIQADKKCYVSFDPSTNTTYIRFNERHSERPLKGKTDYAKRIDGPQPYDDNAVREMELKSHKQPADTDQTEDNKNDNPTTLDAVPLPNGGGPRA
jgi:hypothetical protein